MPSRAKPSGRRSGGRLTVAESCDSHIASFAESLAFPIAFYAPDGGFRLANSRFHALLKQLLPDCAVPESLDLRQLGRRLGVPLHEEREPSGCSCDLAILSGHAVKLTMAPNGQAGWTLSMQDVTEQRQAEWMAERSQKVAVIALADLAEHHDNDTGEHVLRVARLTHEIARWLYAQRLCLDEINESFLRHVGVASILHDVGKVSVPDSILLKPGPLTPEEHRAIQKHVHEGGEILRKAEALLLTDSPLFRRASEIAAYHHERWDGTGYPTKIGGRTIPLGARIVAAADVFDALVSARPYKAPWSQKDALNHLWSCAGSHFDPQVVEALTAVLEARANTIEWSEAWTVGNEQLDYDHRILLALVNQVGCPETKSDPIAIEFILDELLGYTATHFAREEAFMARIGYAGLEGHKAIHRTMIAEVRHLRQRLATFTPNLGADLHDFLSNWLMQHILVEDRRYSLFLSTDAGGP